MTETILTHDAGVSAFEDAGGVVTTDDDDGISFNWDEEHIVRVDAPSDLEGAFDTDRFYKVEDATLARPIKQPYLVGDDIEWYKKPADELRRAAWSFDNKPFTLDHPETGMVKDVNDIHGFWRNIHYVDDEDRLNGDLYVPANDQKALDWLEEHSDVSVGFYNRVSDDYDGDTGDLADDDVDGFQVDMYGNHVAGVETGRCSGEDGCGLDSHDHGRVVMVTDDPTLDAPSGIYEADDGTWLAVAPDEHPDDSTEHPDDGKFPVDSCSDVQDAWGLRGHTDDIDISKETLGNRIQRAARAMDCDVPGEGADSAESASSPSESGDSADESEESQDSTDSDSTEDCGCGDTMTDDNTNDGQDFDIPDLSIDALAEKNDAVQDLKAERDSLREDLDEMKTEIEDALDAAENFSVELEEDECPCEAVDELVSDLDEKVEEVEDLEDELAEYREDEIEDRLDTLEDLGAERDTWEEKADEADDPLDALDEEIERREEVLEAADADVSVKDIDATADEESDTDEEDRTIGGTRTFGRGHGA